ncbi:MAG TPA: VWA domain-containing protein, partial [Candidatus Krumholzibacteria bacterium]|nr:VWA domain-containing protein [Candidatus Krumholzibacteria bacterium]
LFGAFAAALPVIIHFLSRRRVRRVPFSDLRFLDESQSARARSLGVRRWLLLLLRVLAVLLLALASAAPRWGGLAAAGSRAVLLIVDTSASMGTQTAGGTRLAEAVSDARALLAALPGDTAVQIIAAGSPADAVFTEWLPAGAGADRGLDALRAGDGGLDLAAVLRLAARQVVHAPGPVVDVILLGDLQELPDDPDLAEAARMLADAGEVRLVPRRFGEPVDQGGVLAVRLPGRVVPAGEAATVEARVLPARTDQAFTLVLDDRPVAEAVAAGPAGVEQVLGFAVSMPAAGLHQGSVRKESDAFPADDARPFALAVPAGIPVLVVHGPDRAVDGALGRGGWRVLAEALAPGGGDGLFRVSAVPSDEVTTGAVTAAALVALVDPQPLGREAMAALGGVLAAGGAVLAIAGDPATQAYLESALLPLVGVPSRAVYTSGGAEGQRAKVQDRGHPVLNGLPDDAVATLEDVSWRRWYRLEPAGADVPLALAGDDPLILAGTGTAGRWALLPFNLRPESSDLPGSPMALPLLRRLCTWLARPAELAAARNLTVGEDLALRPLLPRAADTLADPGTLQVVGPEPGVERTARLAWSGGAPELTAGPAASAGLAVFMAGPDTVGLAAVGLPASESNPVLLEPEAWVRPLAEAGLSVAGGLEDARPEAVAAAFGGLSLAPWMLLAAALVLAIELHLGRGTGASS